MSWTRSPGFRTGFAGRLQLAGLLIATGIVVELGTFVWNHPVSLFLFLTLGAGLVVAGMLLYLWSVVTRKE
ncbi:MAG: hypothetical protein OXT71_06125 [Acidobacteriota bacterium]|nr:hypothetical protein [Acidobacteriota bacterium]